MGRASGRPGGIVSTSIMHGLSNAQRIFPGDLDALERLGHDNAKGFADTIERHAIDAEIEWGGELTVAVDAAFASGMGARCQLWSRQSFQLVSSG